MNESQFLDRLFARAGRPWVTVGLVAACVLAFAGEVLSSHAVWDVPSLILIRLGGNFAPAVQSGEPWRLLTAVFLHGGLLHIALNMLALWQAGQVVERLFGHLPYLAIYVLAGLAGNLASLWWHPGPVSIGASGAIFGIYGALLAYLTVQRGEVPLHILREIRSSALAFVGYSLFAGFMIPGVDNANHVGGLLAGLVLGAGLSVPLQGRLIRILRQVQAYAALAVVFGACWALWQSAPQVAEAYRQHVAFEQAFQSFAKSAARLEQREADIIAALRKQSMSPALAARELSERIAGRWAANVAAVAPLVVQPDDAARKQVLVQYGTLRQQSAAFLARALETDEQRWVVAAQMARQQSRSLLLKWKMHESLAGETSDPLTEEGKAKEGEADRSATPQSDPSATDSTP